MSAQRNLFRGFRLFRSQISVLIQRVVREDELLKCMLINIPHCSHSKRIVRGIKSLVYY